MSVVADIFREAAARNRADPRRRGNVLHLESDQRVVVTGDLHGHRTNLNHVITHSALDREETTCLILQEVIHGDDDPRTGADRSIEQLLRAVRLQGRYPAKVIFLMGNHDLSQVTGAEILKSGRGACRAFTEGTTSAFGDDAPDVLDAVFEFLRSEPLVVRTPGRTLISHSLPEPGQVEPAIDVLDRPIEDSDLQRGAGVYQWVWGRKCDQSVLDALAAKLDVDFFITGHRKIDGGWEQFDPRAIALSTDDGRGCLMDFSAGDTIDSDNVGRYIRSVASLGAS